MKKIVITIAGFLLLGFNLSSLAEGGHGYRIIDEKIIASPGFTIKHLDDNDNSKKKLQVPQFEQVPQTKRDA